MYMIQYRPLKLLRSTHVLITIQFQQYVVNKSKPKYSCNKKCNTEHRNNYKFYTVSTKITKWISQEFYFTMSSMQKNLPLCYRISFMDALDLNHNIPNNLPNTKDS